MPPYEPIKGKMMPKYQVKTKVNSQTVNTDLECDNKDDALALYNAVSVGDVLELKEYLYSNPSDLVPKDNVKYRYASVKIVFKNKLPITVKIPKLKKNKTQLDILQLFKSLYQNIDKIDVKITSNF